MENTPGEGESSAQEQRIRSLRQLSRDQSATSTADARRQAVLSSPTIAPVRAKRPPRTLIVVGLATLALAVIVAGIVVTRRTKAPPAQTATKLITVAPLSDGLTCARDAAWSPHGDRIALVGYTPTVDALGCPSAYGVVSSGRTGIVSIYRSQDGRLVGQYHPDKAIASLVHVPASVLSAISSSVNTVEETPAAYIIDYTHLLWAPDSTRVYVTWLAMLPTGLPNPNVLPPVWPSVYATGVVSIDLRDGTLKALSTSLGASPYHATEWNLQTGALAPASGPSDTSAPFATLSPAQAYQWTATGALEPGQALPTAGTAALPAPPASPAVGSPQGGATFTIWQPGVLEAHLSSDTTGMTQVNRPTFATSLAAISPDGRYLIEGVSLEGIILTNPTDVTQAQTWATNGLGSLPLLPAHDQALTTLAALPLTQQLQPYALSRTLNTFTTYGVYVAWRPDGRRLAALYSGQSPPAVVIYNCQSGKATTTLIEPSGAPSTDDSAPKLIRWSVDGTRLLVEDPSVGALTIWGPDHLST